ncbi:MAG: hypothetical protein HYW47_02685 [Deltaproteobacteria bacterium]|nr:hypothetical protein [Deltaproteobacteria bacterium]
MKKFFEKERALPSFQIVESLLRKTVFTFTRPLEAQVEEITHRVDRLVRRIEKLSKDA